MHDFPERHGAVAGGSAAGDDGAVVAVKISAGLWVAAAIKTREINRGIPRVLLVADAVAVVAAEIEDVHRRLVQVGVAAVAQAHRAIEPAGEVVDFEKHATPA